MKYLLIAFLIVSLSAQAQIELHDSDQSGYWSVQVENDVFGTSTDRFYTNGLQFNYIQRDKTITWLEKLVDKLPLFVRTDNKGRGYAFGQKMFTPEDTQSTELIENDRPYAGWLYGSASVASLMKNTAEYRKINAVEFTLGIVGPSSLGEQAQNGFHDLIGVPHANGWDNQLRDELGLVVTYVRKSEHFSYMKNSLEYSWSPHKVLALGNVYTYAGGGVMVRFGKNLRNDIGPPNISPGFPGNAFFNPTKEGSSWYLFAGVEGRVMARNIFLDGNTFKDSHSVDKKTLVFDLQYGLAYQRGKIRISYSQVLRSKEFYGQKDESLFGAVNISYDMD